MSLPNKPLCQRFLKSSLLASALTLSTLAVAQQPNRVSDPGTPGNPTQPESTTQPPGGTAAPGASTQPGGTTAPGASTQPGAPTQPEASTQPGGTTQPSGPSQPGGAPQSSQRAVYQAILKPVNSSVAGNVSGGTRIVVDGNNMGIYLQANGLAPQMIHEQFIHASGGKCPDMTADKNGDSIVDEKEASVVMGTPAFPLTLGTQQSSAGAPPSAGTSGNLFPTAGQKGDLIYINSFPVSMVLSALSAQGSSGPQSPGETSSGGTSGAPGSSRNYLPANNPNPSAPDARTNTMNMENSVIEIRGVAPNTQLPGSVGSGSGQANASIPVACGVLIKISD